MPGKEPQQRGNKRNGHHHRHEHAADLVGKLGNGGFGGAGLLHQAHDLGKRCILAYAVGAQLQVAAAVDGRGGHAIARAFFHRQTFACDGGFIHGGLAVQNCAIHRDLAALANDHRFACGDLGKRNGQLLSAALNYGGIRRERQQRGDRAGGFAARTLLKIFADGDKREDHAGRFKVELRHARAVVGEDGDDAVNDACRCAERNERIHVRRAAQQPREADGEVGAVDDEDGEEQRNLRADKERKAHVERGRKRPAHHMPHGKVKQRHKKADGQDQPPLHRARCLVLLFLLAVGAGVGSRLRAVAVGDHGAADGGGRGFAFIERDAHAPCHQVDRNA